MREMSLVSSVGSRLHATVWNAGGPRHLLLHGLASNAATWRQVAERLAEEGAAVASYDQRSHGRSERTDGDFDISTYANDAAAVLDQLGWDDAVVVGQSWGGNVAVELAGRHPGRCRAVVGVDGGFIRLRLRFDTWDACAAALAPPRFGPIGIDDVRARLSAMHPDWTAAGIDDSLRNFRIHSDGSAEPALRFDDHMQILQSLYLHDPADALERTDVPSLALAALPPMTDPAVVESMGFDQVEWIDGDHDLHVHRPDQVTDAIRRFAWA